MKKTDAFAVARCVLVLLFGAMECLLAAPTGAANQDAARGKGGTNQSAATLIVSGFATTFQTKAGERLSLSLPTLIQMSLQSGKYSWLNVVNDSTLAGEGAKFLVSGSILDLAEGFRVNVRLQLIKEGGGRSDVLTKTYSVSLDSLLVQVDRFSKELATAIQGHVSSRREITLVVYPYESVVQDSTVKGVGEYIAKTVVRLSRDLGLTTRAFVGAQRANEDLTDEDLVLSLHGRFSLSRDSIQIVSTMEEGTSGKVLYSLTTGADAFGLTGVCRRVVEAFRGFVLIYPKLRDVFSRLETAHQYYELAEQYDGDKADPESKLAASVLYARSVQLDHRYVPALLRVAKSYHDDQKTNDAIGLYKEIATIDTANPAAYLGLGEAYSDTFRDSLALENYRTAARLGENQRDTTILLIAYRRLGELNIAHKSYDAAIVSFEQALALQRTESLIWFGLGNAYYLRYSESKKQLDDTTDISLALRYFREGRKVFPTDTSFARNASYLLNYWGKVYYNAYREQNDESFRGLAEQKFAEASEIKHDDNELSAENLNYLALISNGRGDGERAKSLSRIAMRLRPDDEWTCRLFAYLHQEDTAHVDEALQSVRKALDLSRSTASYAILANAYITDGNLDSSRAALDSVWAAGGKVARPLIQRLMQSAETNRKLEGTESVLDQFLKQGISRRDSAWAFSRLAAVRRVQKRFDDSFFCVDLSRSTYLVLGDVLPVLDSLYFVDSLGKALDMKINILEGLPRGRLSSWYLRELAFSYLSKKDFRKSERTVNEALHASRTADDTANALATRGRILYERGANLYSTGDSSSGSGLMDQAIENFVKASDLFPGWTWPYFNLQLIYHEYIIDYEKSYVYSKKLLELEPSNITYVANGIEAALTAGRFEEAFSLAENVLYEDTSSARALGKETALAMRFVLMASKVLAGQSLEAYSYLGSFRTDYKNLPEKRQSTWIWTGTKRFLNLYPEFKEPSYRMLLLKVIQALEGEKESGITLLNGVDRDWQQLLRVVTK